MSLESQSSAFDFDFITFVFRVTNRASAVVVSGPNGEELISFHVYAPERISPLLAACGGIRQTLLVLGLD